MVQNILNLIKTKTNIFFNLKISMRKKNIPNRAILLHREITNLLFSFNKNTTLFLVSFL